MPVAPRTTGPHCGGCPFQGRPQVGYRGPLDAEIAVIGEGPGTEEHKKHSCWVGPSGQSLDSLLDDAAIPHTSVRRLNALMCTINKDPEHGDTPEQINEALAHCANYLREEFDRHTPRGLLIFGAVALYQQTGRLDISTHRGQFLPHDRVQTVMATWHPAYLLRTETIDLYKVVRTQMLDDARKLRVRQTYGWQPVESQDWVQTSRWGRITRVPDFWALYRTHPAWVVLDIESQGLHWYAPDFRILLTGVGASTRAAEWVEHRPDGTLTPEAHASLKAICEDSAIKKVLVNGKFDAMGLRGTLGIRLANFCFDPHIGGYLLDENRSNSLENLLYPYVPEMAGSCDWFAYDKSDMQAVPIDVLGAYNGTQLIGTAKLYVALKKKLTEDDARRRFYVKLLHPALRAFEEIEYLGVPIDRQELYRLAGTSKDAANGELYEKCRAWEQTCLDLIPPEIKARHEGKLRLTRDDLIRDVLFSPDGYNLKPLLMTEKTHKPSTSEEHLSFLALTAPEAKLFIDSLIDYDKAKSLRTRGHSYLNFVDGQDLIHASYKLGWVTTGRTSCEDPALQQVPKRGKWAPIFRQIFKAPPGWVWLEADLKMIELKLAAWLFGERTMLSTLQAGADLHKLTGSRIAGCTIDQVTKEIRMGGKCFHPRTEVLTRQGWVPFTAYNGTDEILQAVPTDSGIRFEWTKPTSFELRPNHMPTLVHLENEGIYLDVTPDHRMLARRNDGRWFVTTPQDFHKVRSWANAGVLEGNGPSRTSEQWLRVAIAIQADGSFNMQKPSNRSRSSMPYWPSVKLGFSKSRKIERMRALLAGIPHTESVVSNGKHRPTTSFYIPVGVTEPVFQYLDHAKQFKWDLLDLPVRDREIVLEELQFWDGTKSQKWTMAKYFSKNRKNREVVQALAATTNRKSRQIGIGVSIKDHAHTRGEHLETREYAYTGDIAALSVPSTFVLVRDGGVPVVTGQTSNFGFIYGMSPHTFVLQCWSELRLIVQMHEAERQHRIFFNELYVDLNPAYDRIKAQAAKDGYVDSPLGRRRRLPWIQHKQFKRRAEAERLAINSPIQGMASDLGLIALNWLVYESGMTEWLSPRWFEHDAFRALVRDDKVAEAVPVVRHLMDQGIRAIVQRDFGVEIPVTLGCDVKIGLSLGELTECP